MRMKQLTDGERQRRLKRRLKAVPFVTYYNLAMNIECQISRRLIDKVLKAIPEMGGAMDAMAYVAGGCDMGRTSFRKNSWSVGQQEILHPTTPDLGAYFVAGLDGKLFADSVEFWPFL